MSTDKNKKLMYLVLTAMFLAIALILPFFSAQIKEIGNMLLPMHMPVMLCGLICGWQYGLTIGFIAPILRSALFGMPIMFPSAISMAFELATYGLVIGLLFQKSRWKCIKSLYLCLLISMVAGRVVWGIVQCILLGFGDNGFTISMFVSSAIVKAGPGIILQLLLIPTVMLMLGKTHMVHMNKE